MPSFTMISQAFVFTVIISTCLSHSWVEQLSVIRNGTYYGDFGYPRGYVPRKSDTSESLPSMVYQIPDGNRQRLSEDDLLCSPNQRLQYQTNEYPRLKAVPGDYVALRYLENGHVTQNREQIPYPGLVYVYGTSYPDRQEKVVDVLRRGLGSGDMELLAMQQFDDGRCYELNNSPLSQLRQNLFPNDGNAQWCETDIMIPAHLSYGQTYTIYWIWQKSTNLTDEYYTTCSDVDLDLNQVSEKHPKDTLPQQDPQLYAVPNYRLRAQSQNSICL
jgi:hypothetical protein